MGLIAWLVGSRFGRTVALAITTAGIIALALLKAFSAGRQSAQAQATQDALRAVRQRIRIDENIRSLGADERRERLRRDWNNGR